MRWVLTRTLEESRLLADELGCDVVPCIERHELPWPPWPERPLVFVTSATVARRLVALERPVGTRIAALEPVTSDVLRGHGITPDVTASGGAVALARAVTGPGPILYPTSDLGIDQPEQAEALRILQALGPVHRHVVYETHAPVGLAAELAKHRGDGFVFFSPSAVTHFAAAGGVPGAAVCVGQSTLRAYRERAGWPEPVLATAETVKKAMRP